MRGPFLNAQMPIDTILRDFERAGLASQGELLTKVYAAVQAGEPRAEMTRAITLQYHGPLEWASLQDMAAATEVCTRLVQLWAAAGRGEVKPEHGPESPADTGAAIDWADAI